MDGSLVYFIILQTRLLNDFGFVVRDRLTYVHFTNVIHSVIRQYAFSPLPVCICGMGEGGGGGGARAHVCVRACVYNKRNPSKTGAEACQICCHELSDFFLVDVFGVLLCTL